MKKDLYEYLRSQFSTLEEAIQWYVCWRTEWEQQLPWEDKPGYSQRAMAYHCSRVLEGYKDDPDTEKLFTKCADTKYGAIIFWNLLGEEDK